MERKALTQSELSRLGVEARRRKYTPAQLQEIARKGGLEAARRRQIAEAAEKARAKKEGM